MNRKFNAEEYIVGLNILRHQLSESLFTSNKIREEFKNCGIPSNMLFWTVFSNSGLVQKVENNLYCFKNPDKPIHFCKLESIYKEYKERATIYYNRWYNKKKHKNLLERHDIQDAIKLLQDNGFTIVIDVNNLNVQF